MSIDERIREGLRTTNDVLPAPDIDRALAAVTADAGATHRRTLLVALAAAAAVVAVIAGGLAITRDGRDGPQPVGPTPEPTVTNSAVGPVVRNGRITTAERFLGEEQHGYHWRDFDPVSATGLLVIHRHGDWGLAVLEPTGTVAALTCERDLPCSPDSGSGYHVATLGPGADEVTVATGDHTAQVIGYDGTSRQRIDLSTTVPGGGVVSGLRWSPDGSRLAVLTAQDAAEGSGVAWRSSQVWLVGRDGGDARLAYTFVAASSAGGRADAPDFDARGSIWFPGWTWSWSPDGQALLLEVLTRGEELIPVAVVLQLPPDGSAKPVDAQVLHRSDRSFDWWGNAAWSPDGTRIAVRTSDHITEISAEDGSVLAQHPHDDGWLIWTARDGSRS